MFCTKCGNEMPDGSKFCTKCGAPMGKEVASEVGTGCVRGAAEVRRGKRRAHRGESMARPLPSALRRPLPRRSAQVLSSA